MTDLCENNPRNFVRKFLQEMCILDEFIEEVIEKGITIEIMGKLESKGISSEDINTIRRKLEEAKEGDIAKAEQDAVLKSGADEKQKREYVRKFLQKKGLCDDFITEVLECGVTDEMAKEMECNCKGLTCEDIEKIKSLLANEIGSDFCDCSFRSHTPSSSRVTNEESDYLQEQIGVILTAGLREIVAKKPYDPVEYLGHWLLFYRECEERERRRKQFEAELYEERLKYKTPSIVISVEDSDLGECDCLECDADVE